MSDGRARAMAMNRYGIEATAYWRRWLPRTHAALADPDSFYKRLGDDVQDRVSLLWDALADIHVTPDLADHSKRTGTIHLLRAEAEHTVMRALVQLPPESESSQPTTEPSGHEARLREFDSRVAQQQATVRDLLGGARRISEVSDAGLTEALQLMPELLAALGTSLDEQHALGRQI